MCRIHIVMSYGFKTKRFCPNFEFSEVYVVHHDAEECDAQIELNCLFRMGKITFENLSFHENTVKVG